LAATFLCGRQFQYGQIWDFQMSAVMRNVELRLIAVLLIIVAVFIFWVIPVSIVDPENFGFEQGLAPSFTVYLVAAMAALTLLIRLFKLLFLEAGNKSAQPEPENITKDAPVFGYRIRVIFLACIIFAFCALPYFGFYISGFVFVTFMAFLLGERMPLILGAVAATLMIGIYAAFELGFKIVLPMGEITQYMIGG
jgi:hypothetical protein